MNKKTLLIISGGIEAVPGIQRARDMGYHVVVSDRDPVAPGFKIADDYMIADTYGIDQTIEAAVKYHRSVRPINGVMCMAADVPLTVAAVAEALKLPGIPMGAARLAGDKLAMKKCFSNQGIPIPWFAAVESKKHLVDMVSGQKKQLVLKPVDSRGARGVIKLNPRIDLSWAYEHSLSHSPTQRVMVEEFLEGPQISTESIIINNKAFTSGFADRNYEFLDQFSPYMIENGGQQPSSLTLEEQRQIKKAAERAAMAMGISTGSAKGDMVLTREGPAVIEIAARLSGGWFSTDQIPLATGVDMIGAAVQLALGEPINTELLVPQYQKGVAIRYFFPSPGRIIQILNREVIDEPQWIHKLHFFVEPGDIVEPVSNHTQRAGFVITVGKDQEEAVKRAEGVVETIKIVTEAI
jgi:biotin carboxylase